MLKYCKKPIWSKYPYGPVRTRPYEYTHTVGLYAYGRTVRVYSYGPDRTRTVQIRVWSGTYIIYTMIPIVHLGYL